jgi:hypothetical protein
MALFPLYGLLSSLWPFISWTALFPLQPLSILLPSVLSTALCLLYSHLSPLHPYFIFFGPLSPFTADVPATALFPFNIPLSPVRPYVSSAALYPLYGSLSPLQPSVLFSTLCPLFSPRSPLRPYKKNCETSETTPLVSRNVLWKHHKPFVPFHDILYPLRPFVRSMALPFPLRPSVPYLALCPRYGPLFPQQPSVSSTALFPSMILCPIYSPLSSLRLCLLFSPMSPLWPSVPWQALCSLYGPLCPLRPSKK